DWYGCTWNRIRDTCPATHPLLKAGVFAAVLHSERRVILHCVLQRQLQTQEAFVDGSRMVTIEGDHLRPRLAAPDHLEGPSLDPLDHGISDGGSRFPREAEFGTGTVRLHHRRVGRAGIRRQHMDTFALDFAPQRLAKAGK